MKWRLASSSVYRALLVTLAVELILATLIIGVANTYAANSLTGSSPVVVDPALLAGIVGVALSLGFAYVPGLKTWYDGLGKEKEAGLMALLIVLTAVMLFALGCRNVLTVNIACSDQGIWDLLRILIVVLTTNQSTFQVGVAPFTNK